MIKKINKKRKMGRFYITLLIVPSFLFINGCSENNEYDIPLKPTLKSNFSLALKFETDSYTKIGGVFKSALSVDCVNRLDVSALEQKTYPESELHVSIIEVDNVLNDHYLSTESTKGMKEVFADIIEKHFNANVRFKEAKRLIYNGAIPGRTLKDSPIVGLFNEDDIAWINDARTEIIARLEEYNKEFGTNYALSTDSSPENYITHVTILHRDTMTNLQFTNDEKDEFIKDFWTCNTTSNTDLQLRMPEFEFYKQQQ